jgi:flagellar biosynthesis protein FlhF
MKLKSFFADSVEEAIGLARREMGPDAMLVDSKRSGAEARHLGAYEVVCASDSGSDAQPGPPVPARTQTGPAVEKLVAEVSDLKQQMQRLCQSLTRCSTGMAGVASDPDLSAAFTALTEAELEADLVYEVVSRIDLPFTAGALRDQLRSLIRVEPRLGRATSVRRIIALVGPPGAGKTSALVKLAIEHGIKARKRIQFLSLDTYRIAAAEALQSYAAILGAGCQVLESVDALAGALADHRQADLVLIDTPGLSRNEMDEDLAQAIAQAPDLDIHLVLPASMRTSDLKLTAEQYSIFKPSKLLFTRLDETRTFGPILGLSVRMNLPLSFLSTGQRIPEDLQAATDELLLGLLLKAEPAAAKFEVAA